MAEWRPSLLPLGIPAPPAFMRSTGRKYQLWWPKKNVTEICIQRAGVEKRRQMWHLLITLLQIFEKRVELRNASPTPILLNSNCQTVSRPTHEKGCSSVGKKNMSVVCLPCLRWQVRYQTDEEGWHTKSFFLSFKNTKGRWQDTRFILILNTIVFHYAQARVISSKGHRS